MVLEKPKVKQFVRRFQEKYEEESQLEEFTEVFQFDNEYDDLDYYKVGRRAGIPISVINDSADPVVIISSFVRRLRIGERNYILRGLNQAAEQDDISSIPIEDISKQSVNEWCSKVENANHLFLPADDQYFKQASGWGPTLPENGLNIHWVPLKHDIENGFLLDSSGINVVKKGFEHLDDPSEFVHNSDFDQFSVNNSLALYFGEEVFIDEDQDEKYQRQVDFLYFVMLSEILTSHGSAVKLVPQRELSSE